ncbi:MAG: TldD/PmbA family protein, partial [Candidatus Bathyarchaeia archaeon]
FASRGGAVKGLKGAFVKAVEFWLKKKGMPIITSGIKAGVGIRAVANKAMGFASVSSVEEAKVLEAVEEAVKIAKIRPPDPNWFSLPDPKKPGESGIFDQKVADLDVERMLNMCSEGCVTAADYDKRITQAMTMATATSATFAVVNSHGVEVSDKKTTFTAGFSTKAKAGTEEVSSTDFVSSRKLVEDLRPIARNAAERTIACIGKRALPEKHIGPVVFENTTWTELFSVIFTYGISALNHQENRSVYKGKIGTKVAKEEVTIVDDGTLPEGFGTARIDDEGVPQQKTTIIEKGILANVLYDNYTAKRESRESTGNAHRHGRVTAPYATAVSITPSNLILAPGKGDLQDLVGEVKEGVLVKGSLIGALHSNMITGDFSVGAENAFKIENGQVAYPIKACTVAGNLYEALNAVIAIGNDAKPAMNFICPSIVIDKIVVST